MKRRSSAPKSLQNRSALPRPGAEAQPYTPYIYRLSAVPSRKAHQYVLNPGDDKRKFIDDRISLFLFRLLPSIPEAPPLRQRSGMAPITGNGAASETYTAVSIWFFTIENLVDEELSTGAWVLRDGMVSFPGWKGGSCGILRWAFRDPKVGSTGWRSGVSGIENSRVSQQRIVLLPVSRRRRNA